MKKILAVFHDNNIHSGATKSFLSNIEFLNKNGYKVIALVPRKNGELDIHLKNIGVEVFQAYYGGSVYSNEIKRWKRLLGWCRCFVKTIVSYISIRQLASRVEFDEIDIIYSNTSTIYAGAWLAQWLKVKHLWHFREFCLEDQKSLRLFSKYFIKLAKQSEQIIAISHVLKRYYEEKYQLYNIEVLYNDISPDYIIGEKDNHKGINVLITGTLCEEKGQRIAIDAINQLMKGDVSLYIAGKINPYGESLKKYVELNNISNVFFCGLVKDMNQLRKKIDVSIVCAKKEAFGRTIIEDMLGDIVVIGCDTGAVPELIDDGKNGLLYKYGDIDSLIECLEFVITNNSMIEDIRQNGYDFALNFTKNKTAIRIEELMRKL